MESLGPVYYILIAAVFILVLMGIYIAYLIITTLLMVRRLLEKFEKGSEQIKKEFYDLKKEVNTGVFGTILKKLSNLSNKFKSDNGS